MSWQKNVALSYEGSEVFHLSWSVLTGVPSSCTLCDQAVSCDHDVNVRMCSIAEAQAKGLRSCLKCLQQHQLIWDRLREVDGQIVFEDPFDD